MHDAALEYIARFVDRPEVHGLAVDIGGRETNGHARWLFPDASWTVVDAADGPGVDVVADGATWQPDEPVGFVLFAEVAEHTPAWRAILANIARMLLPDGLCVMTMAGPGRAEHGLFHDDPLVPGWYRNVEPFELDDALEQCKFGYWQVDQLGEDVRAWAQR
jgi:SAM-dependent methyltransferase